MDLIAKNQPFACACHTLDRRIALGDRGGVALGPRGGLAADRGPGANGGTALDLAKEQGKAEAAAALEAWIAEHA